LLCTFLFSINNTRTTALRRVSYTAAGGYMSLAVSFHYPERIIAAIDVVGISNFVTFLTNTESYRRELRRAELAPLVCNDSSLSSAFN
jgi:dipeptidyl aminopeptidase/acylaminoacyl peptidase